MPMDPIKNHFYPGAGAGAKNMLKLTALVWVINVVFHLSQGIVVRPNCCYGLQEIL